MKFVGTFIEEGQEEGAAAGGSSSSATGDGDGDGNGGGCGDGQGQSQAQKAQTSGSGPVSMPETRKMLLSALQTMVEMQSEFSSLNAQLVGGKWVRSDSSFVSLCVRVYLSVLHAK